MKLDQKFFKKKGFSERDIEKLLANSSRDLDIAKKSHIPEVIFKFCYDAFLKACIALIACEDYRLMSRRGYHRAIIFASKKILGIKFGSMIDYCDTMRKKRNLDLYGGGMLVSLSETKQFVKVVSKIFEEIGKRTLAKS